MGSTKRMNRATKRASGSIEGGLRLAIALALTFGLPGLGCDEEEPEVLAVDAAPADGGAPDRPASETGGDRVAVETGPTATLHFTILHTNDLHSHLWGHSPEADYSPGTQNDDSTVGGFARMAAVIKAQRAAAGIDVLLLDGGDFLMGTLFHTAAPIKAPELKLMQSLGYDAATIGNHEFDFTSAGLARIVAAAQTEGVTFPLLATNMKFSPTDSGDDALEALRSESGPIRLKLIKTLPNGLKVGLFGLLGDEASRFAAAARPVTFDPIATAASAMVAELRNTDKVDLVIALSHSGIDAAGAGEDQRLAMAVPGIDVIVSGHTHDKLTAPKIQGTTIIVTAGSYGEFVGRLDLTVSKQGTTVTAVQVRQYNLLPIDDSVTGNTEAQAQVDAYMTGLDALLAPATLSYKKVVAETSFDLKLVPLAESGLGDLVADAYLGAARLLEPSALADFSVEASGQMRADLLEGQTGAIWFSDLFQVTPLGTGPDQLPGTPLITYYLNGPDIRGGLEVGAAAREIGGVYFLQLAGIEVDVKLSNIPFNRVTGARIVREGSAPEVIDLASTAKCYKVVSTLYIAALFGLVEGLTNQRFAVKPKQQDCQTLIVGTELYSRRIDADPAMSGIQELKQYQAVLRLVSGFPSTDADVIPDVPDRYMSSQQRIKLVP